MNGNFGEIKFCVENILKCTGFYRPVVETRCQSTRCQWTTPVEVTKNHISIVATNNRFYYLRLIRYIRMIWPMVYFHFHSIATILRNIRMIWPIVYFYFHSIATVLRNIRMIWIMVYFYFLVDGDNRWHIWNIDLVPWHTHVPYVSVKNITFRKYAYVSTYVYISTITYPFSKLLHQQMQVHIITKCTVKCV